MKITILGAAGVRTPLLVQAILARQGRLGLTELALMDVDAERLGLIGALTAPLEEQARFRTVRTTDPAAALAGADFVITTFRVGGMAGRVVDERVPLAHGVVGQETTGPGGFAMAMRAIPVLLSYLERMRQLCPKAWLVNFANPSGMLAEAATRVAGWSRTVGICDAPADMQRVAAAASGTAPERLFLDYFGLNHLGWVRAVICDGEDLLPRLLAMVRQAGHFPGSPFDLDLVADLGMIPNDYLFYYYHTEEAIRRILGAGRTRGEYLLALNDRFFADLQRLFATGDVAGMAALYRRYLDERHGSHMADDGGVQGPALDAAWLAAAAQGGYAGVALDLIESLAGGPARAMVLNVPNRGAIRCMGDADVVEVPALVGPGLLRPLVVGDIPTDCLGLMQQVKEYERLTIAAAVECSYEKALQALVRHPLVPDPGTARAILTGYRERHGALFPPLG